MRTHLESVIDKLSSLRSEAVRLSGRDHEQDDLLALLKVAGGNLEAFLKALVHVGTNWNLFKLIDELSKFGVSTSDISTLHLLRSSYNSAKHDPGYQVDTDKVTDILDGVVSVLRQWKGLGIGASEHAYLPKYNRRLWLAGWDHFVHGDGEVHIILPAPECDGDFPPHVDVIYLNGLAWPDVLAPLSESVKSATGLIPQRFLDLWEQEGDFAGARVFDGDYRQLIHVLAGAELRLDLIPFLKRENDRRSMYNAVALASVDTALSDNPLSSEDELIDQILYLASSQYAAPVTSPFVRTYASKFAKIIFRLPPEKRSALNGPLFVTEEKFKRLRASAICFENDLLISSRVELVIRR